MKKVLYPLFRAGCLVSLIAPIVAMAVYPRANWLFAFLLLGVVLVIVGAVTRKQPTPTDVANRAERLVDGTYGAYDVDDYEHLNPKNEPLRDLWRETMGVGGLPEGWVKLDDETKGKIREVIAEIRRLEPTANNYGT